MQIISVIRIRDALSKMKHQWKCQARNKHSNKDNSKDKQFPRFQMFSPLGVSLHMFCTQILLCTQHQHAYRGTHTYKGKTYKCPHMSLCRHFVAQPALHYRTKASYTVMFGISYLRWKERRKCIYSRNKTISISRKVFNPCDKYVTNNNEYFK